MKSSSSELLFFYEDLLVAESKNPSRKLELSPLSVSEYASTAERSDRFKDDPTALQNLRFGYFGEIGGLLSALKKANRDKLLETELEFAGEEIGDALWYLVAISSLQGVNPPTLAEACLAALRSHYAEAPRAAVEEVTFRNIDAFIQAQAHGFSEDRVQLLGELAAAAGALAEERHPQTDFRDAKGHPEILGRHLALLARACAVFRLSIEQVASRNLEKTAERWPGPAPTYHSLFDSAAEYPEYEQLPRQFTVLFEERSSGKHKFVVQSIKGIFVGDRLTDNSVEEDGYRFHDVFHLAYVAHLGWSPVIRGLLKRKRKSRPDVDENQDGARAMIIEEGIATWIFNHGKQRGDMFSEVEDGKLAFGLLKQIKSMVRGYEVDKCPIWQWERAILDGFRVFRQLYEAKKGQVHVDMIEHTIKFQAEDYRP